MHSINNHAALLVHHEVTQSSNRKGWLQGAVPPSKAQPPAPCHGGLVPDNTLAPWPSQQIRPDICSGVCQDPVLTLCQSYTKGRGNPQEQ